MPSSPIRTIGMSQTSTADPTTTRPPDGQVSKVQKAGAALAGASQWGERPPAGTYEIYRKMRNEPTIALARAVATAPILTGQWSVKANDGTPDDQVAMIQNEVERIWPSFIENVIFALDYGFQTFEKIFRQRSDGKIGVDLKPLLPDITTALVDKTTGSWAGLKNNQDELGPEKCLWYAYDAEAGNPYGRSRHENIREMAYFPAVQVESKSQAYFTKVAAVTPIIEYPDGESQDKNGTTKPNSQLAESVLTALSTCKGIAMPNIFASFAQDLMRSGVDLDKLKAWHISFLEKQGNHGDEFTNKSRHYESRMMRGWLVPERSAIEATTAGSRADSETAADTSLLVADLTFLGIIRVANEQLVDQLVGINYGPQAVGTIRLERAGLDPAVGAFYRAIMQAALTAPGNIDLLLAMVDFDAMLDAVGLPKSKEVVDPASLTGKVGDTSPQDLAVIKAASLLADLNIRKRRAIKKNRARK